MYKLSILGFFIIAMVSGKPASEFIQESRGLDCLKNQNTEVFSCLIVKTVSALERAARSNDVQIFDGVTFVKTTPTERSDRSMKSELEILNELPEEDTSRTMKMMNMVYDSAHEFFKTHSLKVDLAEDSRAFMEAGRKTGKKMILPIIVAAIVKAFALGPILLGGLGLLVLKAVFVSKIALLVAAILGFQRLFGASGGTIFSKNPILSNGFYEVPANGGWSATSSSYGTPQGYYQRSFDEKAEKDAQNLAYSAHAPNNTEQQQ